MSHRDTSIAIKQALNRSVPNTKLQSQPVCFNEDLITLNCNHNGVSILTNVFSFRCFKLMEVITIPTLLSISHD